MILSGEPFPRPAKRGPGRPTSIDADAIARAVLSIGFRDLTFSAVATHLGVGQATLYRHAANRDELVRLGLERALAQVEWPDVDGPWREMLQRWAIAAWRAWEQYPGAVLEASRGVLPPTIAQLTDRVGAALVQHGFTIRNAVLAVDLVFDLVSDNRRGVEAYDATHAAGDAPVRDVLERDWPAADSLDEVHAQLRHEMVLAIREEPITWFRRKLHIVLAGIAAELAPTIPSLPTSHERS